MANKITGRIIILTPTQTITSRSGNQYQKRDVVIERIVFDRNTGLPTADPTDTPIFSLIGDSCQWLDGANPGDEIIIDYDIRGRAYQKEGETRYLNDIRVFRIEVRERQIQPSQSVAADFPPAATPSAEGMAAPQPLDDDLPF